MPELAETSLTDSERLVVARFVDKLGERLGDRLRAVWLFGSRARGEQPGPESDVDLMVISDGGRHDGDIVDQVMWDVAWDAGMSPFTFMALIWEPDRLRQRRAIRSFFIQEVDRDKVVLYGDP